MEISMKMLVIELKPTSWSGVKLFFEKYSTNADTHTRTSTHPYEHTHARTPYPYEHLQKIEPAWSWDS
jgi:hypothetical protein